MTQHETSTLDHRQCDACRDREARDEYRHGRVGNFYLRMHLVAVAEDRQATRANRIAAARELTDPSYPPMTRRSAAVAIVRLSEPGIAGLVRDYFAEGGR